MLSPPPNENRLIPVVPNNPGSPIDSLRGNSRRSPSSPNSLKRANSLKQNGVKATLVRLGSINRNGSDTQPSIQESPEFPLCIEELHLLGENRTLEALQNFGGVQGLSAGVKSDLVHGLSLQDEELEFGARRLEYGKNVYPEPPIKSFWSMFWDACGVLSFSLPVHVLQQPKLNDALPSPSDLHRIALFKFCLELLLFPYYWGCLPIGLILQWIPVK
mmetsp:Transcript_18681/g.30697  ORF Transcript_18681/g.30697 Transcript_18681/m.30697 type:complete len:217 (-) Transcript_18681:3178-3828(-)